MAGVEHFLEMGGYGAYVWAAYGFTLIVLGGLMWQSWRLARKRVAELESLKDQLRASRPRRARPIVARREGDTPAGHDRAGPVSRAS
jgi:heme exporter protein D